ncbi:MAG: CAP domain-containing protein, partial [Clostridium sp.]
DRAYFDHKNPEGELITSQMQKDGVTYESWAENIAYIQGDFTNSILADNFMSNWMKSEGHRENILSKEFTSIGIGVYKIGNTYYATQQFHK